MKIKVKIAITAGLMMIFLTTAVLSASNTGLENVGGALTVAAGSSQIVIADNSKINKDETIYAVLNGDGSVNSLYAVNHFYVPKDGSYIDYGNYEKIESLTEDIAPQIDADRIQWDLKADFKDFYYKGVLSGGELPWTFHIEYKLDGVAIDAQDLAGKSGTVEMELSVSTNEKAQSCFRDQYAMMIQIPVNLDRASITGAEGATEVIAGRINTLAYTILPGTSKTYHIQLQADNFEMDSINIGLSQADYGNVIETGDITGGFDELSNGAANWLDGIKLLQNGMADLANGVGDLSAGLNDLAVNGKAISKGLLDYLAGLKGFAASFKPVLEGSGQISQGLTGLTQNGDAVLGGYEQMAAAIQAQLPTEAEKAQLQTLAQYAGSTDPLYAQLGEMAQSLLEQSAGTEALYQNLSTLNAGLSQYTGGVSALSQEYQGFDQGLAALSQGSDQLVQGFSAMSEGNGRFSQGLSALDGGLKKLDENAQGIPGSVGKLSDGGSSIKEGIDKAKDSISSMLGQSGTKEPIKSFVSPDKGSVNSVQFIIRTPAITVPDKVKEAPVGTTSKKSFIQKLVELFI